MRSKKDDLEAVGEAVASLSRVNAPPELTARLQVLASREAARRRRHSSLLAWWEDAVSDLRLVSTNLMKPLALPAAGGILSAICLFGLLAPSLWIQRVVDADVPTGLATQASLLSSLSFNLSDEDIVVDVVIDGQGRVIDYSIPRGQAWASDPLIVHSLENTLLCTRFNPATFFGQPATARTRITLRRSHMEVRG